MKKLATLAAVAATVTAGTVFAAAAPVMMSGMTAPWYVGIGANYTSNMTNKISSVDGTSAKLNKRGVGGNVFVGYLVNQYFGAELGFSYLGQDKYKITDAEGNSATAKLKDQYNVHFVGNAYLPVSAWFQPYAFGGVAYMSSKANGGLGDATNNQFGLIYGAGLQFMVQQFGIRASYTRQDGSNSNSGNVFNTSLSPKDYISLDVLYRFGA